LFERFSVAVGGPFPPKYTVCTDYGHVISTTSIGCRTVGKCLHYRQNNLSTIGFVAHDDVGKSFNDP